MDCHGSPLNFIDVHQCSLISIEFHGVPWILCISRRGKELGWQSPSHLCCDKHPHSLSLHEWSREGWGGKPDAVLNIFIMFLCICGQGRLGAEAPPPTDAVINIFIIFLCICGQGGAECASPPTDRCCDKHLHNLSVNKSWGVQGMSLHKWSGVQGRPGTKRLV